VSERRLYLLASGDEIARRRARVLKGAVVEAWPDAKGVGFWVGADSKALLDAAGGSPIGAEISLPASSVPIYYGPKLCDVNALPREESLKARVLSGHAIAVAWNTLDRFGERNSYQPQSAADPTFHLRRPGTLVGHLWRLFRAKSEAVAWLQELYGAEAEAVEWAHALPADDFDALIRRHARSESHPRA
jgi:hypothetical protein